MEVMKEKLTSLVQTVRIFTNDVGVDVVRWTKVELMNLDRKTRQLLIIQDALHARADGSRLYLMRSVVKKEDEG